MISPRGAFLKKFILYWGIADKQCCESSRWTAKGLSHTYTCTHSPPNLPPIQAATWPWAEFPVRYRRSLSVIHFKYSSVYMSISHPNYPFSTRRAFLSRYAEWHQQTFKHLLFGRITWGHSSGLRNTLRCSALGQVQGLVIWAMLEIVPAPLCALCLLHLLLRFEVTSPPGGVPSCSHCRYEAVAEKELKFP